MKAKLLFTGVVIVLMVSSTTFGYAFAVGSANGAGYVFCGPPQSNSGGGSFGCGGVSGSVTQNASAYNPCGIGFVGQCAYAVGGQGACCGMMGQGYCAEMSQGTVKCGGSGAVAGMQYGGIQMNQASCGGFQSSYATGMQFSGAFGGGSGANCQSMNVGSAQFQIR
jgi:hypothetical protein